MTTIRIIKKYPNRRLYDTEISSYITIEDVRQLIVDNESFQVRDAKTGADLTRQVLLQIITEHEQDGQPMLSTELLSQLIRFYGTLTPDESLHKKRAFRPVFVSAPTNSSAYAGGCAVAAIFLSIRHRLGHQRFQMRDSGRLGGMG